MAQLPTTFDPSQYSDMRDFTPVPPGKYIAKATDSELKPTGGGSGQMLVINFVIAAGPYMGKTFVSRLNLVNANATTVKIANEELATLTRACGLGPIQETDLLNNIAIVASLGLEPGDEKYGPSNKVLGYSSAAGITEVPVNPEPDEMTLAIMMGTAHKQAKTAGEAAAGVAPQAPAGFAANTAAQTAPPPPTEAAPNIAPPPPEGAPANSAPPPPPPPPGQVQQTAAVETQAAPVTQQQPVQQAAPPVNQAPAGGPPW